MGGNGPNGLYVDDTNNKVIVVSFGAIVIMEGVLGLLIYKIVP
jgi:hypothetical protein